MIKKFVKIDVRRLWTAIVPMAIISFAVCLAACGGDDAADDTDGSGTPDEEEPAVDLYQPVSQGWYDDGQVCYYVNEVVGDAQIEKSHYKYEFDGTADDAKCVSAVCEMLAKSATDAMSVAAMFTDATIRDRMIVSYALTDHLNKTKKQVRNMYVEDPEPEPTIPFDENYFVGKWVVSSVKSALGDEEAILAGDQYRTKRWEFKADGTAVWSYRSWSDKWSMYDPWNESPKKYTWEFSTYNKDTYILLLIHHEGTPGFGDYRKTITRRYIKAHNDNYFYWENDPTETLDGKPYRVAETYTRDTAED